MRKFKVLKLVEQVRKVRYEYRKNSDGTRYRLPIHYIVKRGEKDANGKVFQPGAYGHENINVGDVIELSGEIADKAASNPHFEEVFEQPKEVAKKKVGRPKKAAA